MTGLMSKLLVLFILLWASTGYAFVERLHPNNPDGGGIPCSGLGAMLFFYALPEGYTGSQIGDIIKTTWLNGGEWTAQDQTDNAAIIGMIDGASTAIQKQVIIKSAEYLCFLWEMKVSVVDTPEEYRAALGIAP